MTTSTWTWSLIIPSEIVRYRRPSYSEKTVRWSSARCSIWDCTAFPFSLWTSRGFRKSRRSIRPGASTEFVRPVRFKRFYRSSPQDSVGFRAFAVWVGESFWSEKYSENLELTTVSRCSIRDLIKRPVNIFIWNNKVYIWFPELAATFGFEGSQAVFGRTLLFAPNSSGLLIAMQVWIKVLAEPRVRRAWLSSAKGRLDWACRFWP